MSLDLTAQSREKAALTERRNLLTEIGLGLRWTQAVALLGIVAFALLSRSPLLLGAAALVLWLSRYLPMVLWRYGRARADFTGLACSVAWVSASHNRLQYRLARVNAEDLERIAPQVAARIGRSTYAIERRSRSRATLTLHRHDPLARAVEAPARSRSVTLGIGEDGSPLAWDRTPLLVAGAPGQGKSFLLASLVEQLAAAEPDSVRVLVDLKQVSLLAQADLFEEVATDYGSALGVLEYACRLLRERYSSMVAQNVDEFQGPRIYVFCDELSELINSGDKARDERALALLRSLARLGRQGGMVLVAASQVLSVDVIDSSLRNLFLSRVAFALPSPEAMRSALGTAGDPALCSAPGVGLALLPGCPQPVRFKGLVPRRKVGQAVSARPAPAVSLGASVKAEPAPKVAPRVQADERPAAPSSGAGSVPLFTDRQRLLDACHEPRTIKALAAAVGLPEAAVRALATALVEDGLLTRTGSLYAAVAVAGERSEPGVGVGGAR